MVEITLSFDNGPSEDTPAVLDLLAEHEIKASFFVIGQRLEDPAFYAHMARAAREGHWIGNHTYTHTYTLGQFDPPEAAVEELRKADALIGDFLHPRRFVRPFGDGGILDERVFNPQVIEYFKANRSTVVMWNTVPRDWEGDPAWVDRALRQCELADHPLMVVHDIPNAALLGLARFLKEAKARGATFRQDFPSDCIIIEQGEVVQPIDHLIAKSPVKRTVPLGGADVAGRLRVMGNQD